MTALRSRWFNAMGAAFVVTSCVSTSTKSLPATTAATQSSGVVSVGQSSPSTSDDAQATLTVDAAGTATRKPKPRPKTTPRPPDLSSCTYVISPSGTDSANGTVAQPWRTLDRAGRALKAGDVLCARGGTYDGGPTLSVVFEGTAAQPITIRSAPGERAVFDGTTGPREFMVLGYKAAATYVVIENITIQNWVNTESGTGAIYVSKQAAHLTFRGNKFFSNGREGSRTDHDLYISEGAQDILVDGNYFEGAPGAAIHVWDNNNERSVNGLTIRNNTIVVRPKGNWGILISTDATNVLIERNLLIGSAGCPDSIAGCGLIDIYTGDARFLPVHDVIIRANVLVTEGDGPAISVDNRNFSILDQNNLMWSTTPGSAGPRIFGQERLTTEGRVVADPQFATTPPFLFTIKKSSPARAMRAGPTSWESP